MTVSTIALIGSVIASGLFAGLMFTLVVPLNRMWANMGAADYIHAMQAFLPAAKGHPLIAALTFIPIMLPVVAAVGLTGSTLVLILGGGVLSVGVLVATLALNFPIYDALMAAQPGQPPPDWEHLRRRFQRVNGLRFALSLCACVLFLIVLA